MSVPSVWPSRMACTTGDNAAREYKDHLATAPIPCSTESMECCAYARYAIITPTRMMMRIGLK